MRTTLAVDTTSEVALIQVYSVGRKKIEETPQFFAPPHFADSFTNVLNFFPDLRRLIIFSRINVGGGVYNRSMKKRKPPLNKVAQATRNAHSAELFRSLLLNKHLVITPTERKGSRQANKRKAISEHS